jgi:hypothetical protein
LRGFSEKYGSNGFGQYGIPLPSNGMGNVSEAPGNKAALGAVAGAVAGALGAQASTVDNVIDPDFTSWLGATEAQETKIKNMVRLANDWACKIVTVTKDGEVYFVSTGGGDTCTLVGNWVVTPDGNHWSLQGPGGGDSLEGDDSISPEEMVYQLLLAENFFGRGSSRRYVDPRLGDPPAMAANSSEGSAAGAGAPANAQTTNTVGPKVNAQGQGRSGGRRPIDPDPNHSSGGSSSGPIEQPQYVDPVEPPATKALKSLLRN